VLVANALLGVSQGLTWSTTVIMKIDLVGPHKRGLAMGLNEFAGSRGGRSACHRLHRRALRAAPPAVYLGVALSCSCCRRSPCERRTTSQPNRSSTRAAPEAPHPAEVFWRTTLRDRDLSSVTQAGLVNNLNDGMAWGLFPVLRCGGLSRSCLPPSVPRPGGSPSRHWAWPTEWQAADRAGMWGEAGIAGRAAMASGFERARAARSRNGNGLPDAARRDRRRRASRLARVLRGRLPAMARPRLRRRGVLAGVVADALGSRQPIRRRPHLASPSGRARMRGRTLARRAS
jgi:hypothetical protein